MKANKPFPLSLNDIVREPYRLFFPLAILMGLIGVSHWTFYAKGWMEHYSGFFHSTMQIFTYMHCFVIGFLLTAMPRFSASPSATKSEVFFFLMMIVGMSIFLSLGQWVIAEILYMFSLFGLIPFALIRVRGQRESEVSHQPPQELVWIPIAILHGLLGTLLMILGQTKILPSWAILIGKPMMEQGFLLCIVMGVGGFLAPRLMGTYRLSLTQDIRSERMCCYFLFGSLLFISFFLEGLNWSRWGYLLRGLVVATVFRLTRSLVVQPEVKDLYVRLVWISVWMIIIGFWGVALWPAYRITMLHLAYIGGFSLLTFAIATMVILSHAGEGERLHTPIWILWIVALGISLALLKRAAVVMFPDAYFKFLGMSATIWCLTAFGWLCFIFPRLFKVPSADEFERMHEEAKRRLRQNQSR